MGGIHFTKKDSQIRMSAHSYQSWGKGKFNHRKLKLNGLTLAIVSKNLEQLELLYILLGSVNCFNHFGKLFSYVY